MAFFAKKAGDLDMIAIHNKAGASGVINDMVTGDTQASFLNVASTAAMIKAGKIKRDRSRQSRPAAGLPRRTHHAGSRHAGRRHARVAGDVCARRHAQGGAADVIFEASVKALQAPAAQEAFKKQNFNIVPNKSVDDAKTWLAGEIKTWKTISGRGEDRDQPIDALSPSTGTAAGD